MTHECAGEGRGEVAFGVFVDDGVSSTLIIRGAFTTEQNAEESAERYRTFWAERPYRAVEARVVQVCVSPGGGWQICGGREAVIPARLRAKS